MRGDAESDMPGNDGETAGGRSAMFLGAVPDEPGEGGKSGNERLFPAVPLAYPGFSHYLCMQLKKSSTRRENIIYM